MLHGLGQRKVHLRQLFASASKCPFEDVITSTVFGPLEFLPVQDAWTVVKTIARRMAVPGVLLAGRVDQVVPRFWPREPSTYRRRCIEPDLVVEAYAEDVLVVRLIIEVKWGAGLEANQLVAAWDAFSSPGRSRTYQLLLVLDPDKYVCDVEKELREREAGDAGREGWRDRLVVRSWRELSHAFQELRTSPVSPGVRRWAELATGILRHEDVTVQAGWQYAGLRTVAALAWKFAPAEVATAVESVA